MIDLKKTKLGVMDYVIVNDKLWFVSAYYNFLFKLDLKDWLIKGAFRMPFGKAFDTFTIFALYTQDNNIVMFPNSNIGGIIVFDVLTESMKLVNLDLPKEKWGNNFTSDKDYIYFPIKNKNKILVIDKKNYKNIYIDIPYDTQGIVAIKKAEDIIWMVDASTGGVLKWNMTESKVHKYESRVKGYNCIDYSSSVCGLVGNSELYLFPRFSNAIIKVENDDVSLHGDMFHIEKNMESIFTCVHEIGQDYMAYYNIGNMWRVYGKNMNIMEEKVMKFSESICHILQEESLFEDYGPDFNRGIMEEKDKIFTLEAFIRSL